MAKLLFILSALAIFALCFADFVPVEYKDCKSGFKIKSVEADNCGGGNGKCVFKRGSKPVIRIKFVPDRDVEKLTASVRSKMAGGSTFTTFTLGADDACFAGNLKCPVKAGEEQTYEQSVEIATTYPLVDDVQVNWALNDSADDKNREVCIVFLAQIVE
uniref:MD-2-related lipid-recognition domain-containing protein n=1 Tax=Panagrolaimus sp. PS1159 TaxID=55785 RepID=A0AC35GMS7_9BILA